MKASYIVRNCLLSLYCTYKKRGAIIFNETTLKRQKGHRCKQLQINYRIAFNNDKTQGILKAIKG